LITGSSTSSTSYGNVSISGAGSAKGALPGVVLVLDRSVLGESFGFMLPTDVSRDAGTSEHRLDFRRSGSRKGDPQDTTLRVLILIHCGQHLLIECLVGEHRNSNRALEILNLSF